MAEQRTFNPRVGGSNPPGGTPLRSALGRPRPGLPTRAPRSALDGLLRAGRRRAGARRAGPARPRPDHPDAGHLLARPARNDGGRYSSFTSPQPAPERQPRTRCRQNAAHWSPLRAGKGPNSKPTPHLSKKELQVRRQACRRVMSLLGMRDQCRRHVPAANWQSRRRRVRASATRILWPARSSAATGSSPAAKARPGPDMTAKPSARAKLRGTPQSRRLVQSGCRAVDEAQTALRSHTSPRHPARRPRARRRPRRRILMWPDAGRPRGSPQPGGRRATVRM